MADKRAARTPLSESQANGNTLAAIRLVPRTPPSKAPFQREDFYSRKLPGFDPERGPGNGLERDPGKPPGRHPDKDAEDGIPAAHDKAVRTTHNSPALNGSPAAKPKPLLPKRASRKRLHIHEDSKTFSLYFDGPGSQAAQEASSPSPSPSLSPTPNSPSQAFSDLASSDALNAPGPNLCASFIGADVPRTPSGNPISVDPIANSPWNYQFVGGLRKVPKTPDLKEKAIDSPGTNLSPLSDGEYQSAITIQPSPPSPKTSFYSANSVTTVSETSNYKVYRDITPSGSEVGREPPSSSNSNHYLVEEPSPESSVIYRPRTGKSDSENYELHGDPSPTPSFADLSRQYKYSQESLVLPQLRARASRDDLSYHRSGSLTSISTILSQQEAFQAIIGRGYVIQLPLLQQVQKSSSSWPAGMIEHPHQWSSQLSTVLSVSDSGSDRDSRSWIDDGGRRSSYVPSTPSHRSRRLPSIGSSLTQEEGPPRSRGQSIEAPPPTFNRYGQRYFSSSSVRVVEDQDEYGDGITDMQELRTRPSRGRLSSGFFSSASSENGRTYTMRSTASSRANSLLASSIPAWARLYYGSGERRYLGALGSSSEATDSRASSFRSGSPNPDHFPLSLYSPRRRPRNVNPHGRRQGSMDINPAAQFGRDGQLINDPYSRRLRTWSMSSIWSPHLRVDRRAVRRSVWEPPSVNWSTEGVVFGRRNIQIVMFITGFIFPFAWIIAAFLPLPPRPKFDMRERYSTSNIDSSNNPSEDFAHQFGPVDEARYESALWWRKLNQWMAFVGVLIIASVIVLVVIGVKENW